MIAQKITFQKTSQNYVKLNFFQKGNFGETNQEVICSIEALNFLVSQINKIEKDKQDGNEEKSIGQRSRFLEYIYSDEFGNDDE